MDTSAEQQVVLEAISNTPYSCTKIHQLNGGSVNFVYLGTLHQPISHTKGPAPINSILIKHSTGYLSCNKNFLLEVSRWKYEVYMLQALDRFHGSRITDGAMTRTPKLLYADQETNVQVIEYIPDSIDLKQILVSTASTGFTPSRAVSSGVALGRWLRDFHDWTSHSDQAALRQHVKQNRAMSELKYRVEYGVILKVLENFPDVLAPNRTVLEEVVRSAEQGLELDHASDASLGVIHGDFWTGK
jgi:hypothetical protein